MTRNIKILCVLTSFIAITGAFPEQVQRRPNIDNRIVGGFQTSIETFPYQVSLQQNQAHKCGGAIVRKTLSKVTIV